MLANSISASRVCRPRCMATWIRRCVSALRTSSPNSSESRQKSSVGARVIVLIRSLIAIHPTVAEFYPTILGGLQPSGSANDHCDRVGTPTLARGDGDAQSQVRGSVVGTNAATSPCSFARNSDGSVGQHDGQVWRVDPRRETLSLEVHLGSTPIRRATYPTVRTTSPCHPGAASSPPRTAKASSTCMPSHDSARPFRSPQRPR